MIGQMTGQAFEGMIIMWLVELVMNCVYNPVRKLTCHEFYIYHKTHDISLGNLNICQV